MSSSIPTQQKVLYVQERRGAWTVSDADVPKPGPGEVLVRVEAVGLNPVDWKIQTYGVAVDDYPAILGSDCAGVVVEVGEGVIRVNIGDRVLHQGAYVNRYATFQQYTIAHSNLVAKIPSNISFDQAASIPVALSAATFGLYGEKVPMGGAALTPPWKEEGKGKYTGQRIIVFGGASSVGQYVIQLAKLSGFTQILTTTSPRNFPLVESLGATHPIDRSLPLSSCDLLQPSPVVFDAVGSKETQQAGWDLLGPDGTLVVVLPEDIENKGDEEKQGKTVVSTFATVHVPVNRRIGEELYGCLEGLLERGDVKPNQIEYVSGGLGSIPEAFERMKRNEVGGKKLIVRLPETA